MLAPLALAVITAQIQSPRTSTAPLPAGQRAVLKDGDEIYMERGARVKVVTRSEGIVRAIYNAEQRWLVLLIDYAEPNGGQPDGFVDFVYTFNDLQGEWPLGPRWDGSGAIEEVTLAGAGGRVAVNLRTQSGLYQIANAPLRSGAPDFAFDSAALARLSHRSGSAGGVGRGVTFDAAEQREVEKAGARAKPPMSLQGTGAPVRVGGAVAYPKKIVDAKPDYPAMAQSVRIQGVVIVEITIGTDGSVTDAKVLRSIELLDRAAVDCVRQWKYEPTLIDGKPVPVIMTVTVNFTLMLN